MVNVYTIIRSCRKTLAIYIKPDGTVEVRAPIRLSKSEIERFVKLKSQWIEQKQAQIAAKQQGEPRELPQSPYASGEFQKTTRELINTWEQRLGVKASYVGFRVMTSRWGSCTPKTGRIRLNAALIYCPRECLEYIIVHELTHLLENNHGINFWKTIKEVLPDYKDRQKKTEALSWLLNAQIKD